MIMRGKLAGRGICMTLEDWSEFITLLHLSGER